MPFSRFISVPGPALLLLAAAFALALTLRLVPKNEGRGRRDLIAFLWTSVCWSGCAMAENLPLPPALRQAFGNLAWFFIALAPLQICFLLWSSAFGNQRPLAAKLRAGAIAFSAFVCLMAFSNPAGLMYERVIASADSGGPLQYVHGPFFYWVVAFLYCAVLLTIVTTTWAQRRASVRRRRIHVGIVLSVSVPLIASAAYVLGWLLVFDYDPTPFTFLFMAPVLASLLAYHDLCDPLPIARRELLDVLGDSVLVLDNTGRIVECNQAAKALAQMPRTPIGVRFSTLPYWRQAVDTSLSQPGKPITVTVPLAQPQHWEMTTTVLEDADTVAGYLLLLRDITSRQETDKRLHAALDALNMQLADNKMLQADLHQQARRDPLTGLYNRRALDEVLPLFLDDATQAQRPLSVAMIDLDHFKAINDEYGHVFGDSVLKAFGAQLARMAQPNEQLYRMGGEEFLVLFPDTTDREAQEIVGRWLEICRRGLLVDGHHLHVGFSSGINTVPGLESDPTMLVAHADSAAYLAKHLGRNQIVCYDQTRKSA